MSTARSAPSASAVERTNKQRQAELQNRSDPLDEVNKAGDDMYRRGGRTLGVEKVHQQAEKIIPSGGQRGTH